jgi:hypothetical protein
MLDALFAALQPWAEFYAASTVIPPVFLAVHVVTMFVGGGVAMGADRQVLRVRPEGHPDAPRVVNEAAMALASTHALVVAALVFTVASGVGMATADAETFLASPLFLTKMGIFVALLVNAVFMRRAEGVLRAARVPDDASTVPPVFSRIQRHAAASAAGWIAVVLLGVLL